MKLREGAGGGGQGVGDRGNEWPGGKNEIKGEGKKRENERKAGGENGEEKEDNLGGCQ